MYKLTVRIIDTDKEREYTFDTFQDALQARSLLRWVEGDTMFIRTLLTAPHGDRHERQMIRDRQSAAFCGLQALDAIVNGYVWTASAFAKRAATYAFRALNPTKDIR